MHSEEAREGTSHGLLVQKYEIIRQLGQGTEGKVYLAKDLHLDRLAAVKERVWKEEEPAREVSLLKELEHPGLPGIYDFFRQGEREYLVMEYVEGITLREYLQKNGKVDARQAAEWILELCEVLSYLHGRGQAVIHRDLKPENMIIRPDGRIKLIDLGAALCGFGDDPNANLAGTPGYCPKEQWQVKRGDRTWDVYALCAVLHEMLTGENPSGISFVRLPIREYDRSLPKGLEQVIRKGTCEDHSGRYQTMEELREALLCYDKGRWQEKLLGYVKRGTVYGLFLAGVGTLLFSLYAGVPEYEIPVPFLCKPLILMGGSAILGRFFERQGGGSPCLRKREKNIWLTEKKFSGLYGLLLLLLGGFIGGMTCQNISYAEEKAEKLWVEMRDDLGRKMLLKEDAVYVPEECVRFEIPKDSLPEEVVSVRIVAEGEGGNRYVSRVFLVGGSYDNSYKIN